jgi:hypothetical protein
LHEGLGNTFGLPSDNRTVVNGSAVSGMEGSGGDGTPISSGRKYLSEAAKPPPSVGLEG